MTQINPIETGVISGWQLTRFRLASWLASLRSRLPSLVWYGQKIHVRVTLSHIPFEQCQEIENRLDELGIRFDTGQGAEGRDWEWDWSLSGPISVRFVSRARDA